MIIENLSPDGLTPLWKKSQIELALSDSKLPSWVQKSYDAFVEIMRGDDFPCFFGNLAEQKEMVRYAIAPSVQTSESWEHIIEAIYLYLEEESYFAGNSTGVDSLFLTLVVFFPPEGEHLLEDYAEQVYTFLNGLHQRDRIPWPENIPRDPQDIHWRYCLGGRSLFVNVCTPANHNRRSRNLGPGLTMVINPDDLFARVWERWGEDPRHKIYHRVEKYDHIPPHPLVKPWDPEEERNQPHAKVTVLADHNDRQCVFPFRYFSLDQRVGGCPIHSSSSSVAQNNQKSP